MNKIGNESKDNQLVSLVDEVLKTTKYSSIYEKTIRHIGSKELLKYHSLKKAIKSTKNKLHQIAGVYFLQQPKYDSWLTDLLLAKKQSRDELKKHCLKFMKYHSSTKERLNYLCDFYQKIFSLIPQQISSIMDLACGLNPLAIPWMPISKDATYYAIEIYQNLITFLNRFWTILPINGFAQVIDLIEEPPQIKADLVFLLKTLPCLEQYEKFSSLKLLEVLNAKFIVVTFPIESLGGKTLGMKEYYSKWFLNLIKDKNWETTAISFRNESAFIIQKE